jgi:hypothetical protein
MSDPTDLEVGLLHETLLAGLRAAHDMSRPIERRIRQHYASAFFNVVQDIGSVVGRLVPGRIVTGLPEPYNPPARRRLTDAEEV